MSAFKPMTGLVPRDPRYDQYQNLSYGKPLTNSTPTRSPYASYAPSANPWGQYTPAVSGAQLPNYSVAPEINYLPIDFTRDPTTTATSTLRQSVLNTPSLGLSENMGGIKTGNVPIPGRSPFADPAATGFDLGKYINKDTLGLAIDGLQGVGSLLQGWSALKNAKLGKQQLAENIRMYDQNYAAQRTLTNNAIADQNAYKIAQGMSNLSNLVL